MTTTLHEDKGPRNKGAYILPNLITSASLFAGFLAMILASKGQFESASYAILFSAVMDGLDGKVARLTNSASEFGVQYDSLADLVAFGAAPAFMMHQYQLAAFNKLGLAVCFLFLVCTALRLARFNVMTATTSKRFFIGLPTPSAGCALALLVLISSYLPLLVLNIYNIICLLITCALAFLMVSNVRYTSFKELGFIKTQPFKTVVFVVIMFSLLISEPILCGFLFLYGYILFGFVTTYIFLPRWSKKKFRHPENKD